MTDSFWEYRVEVQQSESSYCLRTSQCVTHQTCFCFNFHQKYRICNLLGKVLKSCLVYSKEMLLFFLIYGERYTTVWAIRHLDSAFDYTLPFLSSLPSSFSLSHSSSSCLSWPDKPQALWILFLFWTFDHIFHQLYKKQLWIFNLIPKAEIKNWNNNLWFNQLPFGFTHLMFNKKSKAILFNFYIWESDSCSLRDLIYKKVTVVSSVCIIIILSVKCFFFFF